MNGRKASQATLLVDLARETGVELFHGSDETAYIRIPCGTHHEVWPLRSKASRRWLARLFFLKHETTPGAQALTDALLALEGISFYEGFAHDVHLRLAADDRAIYLDLADDFWNVVEITDDGWKLVADPPVRFRRPRGMLALPQPARGGRLEDLREFVNVADDDWPLVTAWLVAALRPQGPFPVLPIHGEQGSAKSTTVRVLRQLVDPNVAPLRSEPRNGRDLAIAANNAWVLAFDNLSAIPDWLSDAFCRVATGGGFATRELYSDTEEILLDAQRPLAVNGIAELATRPDLLDRSIPLYLPRLRRWIPEDDFFARFHRARARILGAVLDAVSAALRDVETVKFSGAVRMADFAKWSQAAEPALGIARGTFMRAYMGNRAEAVEITLEASPLTEPLRAVAESGFEGSATELLSRLAELAEEKAVHGDAWPRSASVLGTELRRLAPVLRRIGLEIEFTRGPGGRRRLIVVRKAAEDAVTAVTGVTDVASSEAAVYSRDGCDTETQARSNGRPSTNVDPSLAAGEGRL